MISDCTLSIRLLNHANFVADLGAAQNCHERFLGMLQRLAQVFQFLLHEQPGGGLLHELGHPNGGCVGAMRGAERVVHVVFRQVGELPGKLFVVRFFLGMEA